ncbi:universal stress protein [Mariniphaga sediminis]|jgi:nucleotide-binding universal stress UspA family protein|uniref:Universal stress protein n=1 Tax=Mariniphaga sediminis TaxID=1628158 RepID=A0A399CWQ2_9BACT|nr:universal stress protein [Mariniphaga sediminis]RIH63408.1 universal stress protein [Mariniphaga sediminis]
MITRKTFLKRFFRGIEGRTRTIYQHEKMKKILIALDYDPSAQKVAETGFSFAKTMKSAITLMHVLVNPQDYKLTEPIKVMGFAGHLDTSKVMQEETFNPEKVGIQFLDKSKLYLGDNSIETLIKEGDCAETILKEATRISADIIVMGSHSRKWFENTTMGSVTEKVLQNTTIPVLIIPTKKQSKS